MTPTLITADNPRWKEFLERVPHDFYHRPEYNLLDAAPDHKVVAYLSETCLIPFLLKPIPSDPSYFDAQSAYGYPGALFTSTDASAIATLAPELATHNVVSAFIRMHPLLNADLSPFRGLGTLVHHGETVTIDTTQSDEQIWTETRNNHRRGIKTLLKEGATVEVDESWTSFPDFHACYTQTMQRVQASSHYFFPPDYFHRLREITRLHLCVVRIREGVACGGVFSEVGDLMQYHLGGTADACLEQHPSKLMFHHIRSFARERGVTRLHLGGGVGGQADSLFQFKQGFSKITQPFHTWRLPIQPDTYNRLVKNWESAAGTPAEPITGYFPPYRKPIPKL